MTENWLAFNVTHYLIADVLKQVCVHRPIDSHGDSYGEKQRAHHSAVETSGQSGEPGPKTRQLNRRSGDGRRFRCKTTRREATEGPIAAYFKRRSETIADFGISMPP